MQSKCSLVFLKDPPIHLLAGTVYSAGIVVFPKNRILSLSYLNLSMAPHSTAIRSEVLVAFFTLASSTILTQHISWPHRLPYFLPSFFYIYPGQSYHLKKAFLAYLWMQPLPPSNYSIIWFIFSISIYFNLRLPGTFLCLLVYCLFQSTVEWKLRCPKGISINLVFHRCSKIYSMNEWLQIGRGCDSVCVFSFFSYSDLITQ